MPAFRAASQPRGPSPESSTELRLVGRRTVLLWTTLVIVLPSAAFAASTAVTSILSAWINTFAAGLWILPIAVSMFLLVACLIPLTLRFLLKRPVVTVGALGLRAAPAYGRELVIDWRDVTGVRLRRPWHGFAQALAFEIDPQFWQTPYVRRWGMWLATRDLVLIRPAGMSLPTALETVAARVPPGVIVTRPDRPAPTAWGPAGAALAITLAGALIFAIQPMLALASRTNPTEKPGAISPSPCRVISSAAVATLVPEPRDIDYGNSIGTPNGLSDSVSWRCTINTRTDRRRESVGTLTIDVARYGTDRARSAVQNATAEYLRTRNSLATAEKRRFNPRSIVRLSGLGDQAILIKEVDTIGRWRNTATVIAQAETTVVRVSYLGSPTSPDRISAGPISIVDKILGFFDEK